MPSRACTGVGRPSGTRPRPTGMCAPASLMAPGASCGVAGFAAGTKAEAVQQEDANGDGIETNEADRSTDDATAGNTAVPATSGAGTALLRRYDRSPDRIRARSQPRLGQDPRLTWPRRPGTSTGRFAMTGRQDDLGSALSAPSSWRRPTQCLSTPSTRPKIFSANSPTPAIVGGSPSLSPLRSSPLPSRPPSPAVGSALTRP